MSDRLSDELVELYNLVKTGMPDKVIDKLFGIDDIKFHVSDIIESIYKDYFVSREYKPKTSELFVYDDAYDFLNTIYGFDPDDLYIFFEDRNLMLYVLDIIKLLNRVFNKWIQGKSSGYRKGSKLILEVHSNEEITLIFRPDLNLK